MSYPIAELDRRLANIVRVGRVTAVDHANGRATVDFGDHDTDADISVPRAGSGLNFFAAPSVGEQVTVMCPSGDLAQAIITGSLPASNAPAADDKMTLVGDLVIIGDVKITGNLTVVGTITATVDVIGAGISLKGHIHPESIGSVTGAPQ